MSKFFISRGHMYELIDGIISIFGGVLIYLIGCGKVRITSNQDKNESLKNRFRSISKVVAPILIIFGVIQLGTVFLT